MTAPTEGPRLPPRWFVRAAWVAHRVAHRLTGGRRGLWKAKPGKWGTLRLTTIGRRSGQETTGLDQGQGDRSASFHIKLDLIPCHPRWAHQRGDPDGSDVRHRRRQRLGQPVAVAGEPAELGERLHTTG